tara:strand:+ start:132 stop:512 length:381 start_codon:yes stop_codon:yes gene_type:complete
MFKLPVTNSLNSLIIVIGVVVMVLTDQMESELSAYSLSLTITALALILLNMLSKKNDEALLVVVILLLSLYQVVGGILKIIAAERLNVTKASDDKTKASEILCYVMGGLSVVAGMTLFSLNAKKLN